MKNQKEILQKHTKALLEKKNVVAVGIGLKTTKGIRTTMPAIICSVEKKVPLSELRKRDVIPSEVNGVATDVVQTGAFKALKARTDRWRPAPPGVSIGHEKISAGTLGAIVKKNGSLYILSNNHVLAAQNEGALGSAILQPGKADGGEYPRDRIAALSDFVRIQWAGGEGCKIGKALAWCANSIARLFGRKTMLEAVTSEAPENLVDAAIAYPIEDSDVVDELLELGKIQDVNLSPVIGMAVRKSGRTTAVTEGEITQTDVIVQVGYGDGRKALFVDQLMVEPGDFSAPGDSGSVIIDSENNIVGLLFAGSDTSTIVNRIGHVFDLLEISL
ncbi:hypothetical protein ES703_38523 [subsurface metagenome]